MKSVTVVSQRFSNVAQFQMGVCFCSRAEISPLSTLSAEVSPIWPYVLIFSRLMATLRAQTFVSVGVCSQSDIALSLS